MWFLPGFYTVAKCKKSTFCLLGIQGTEKVRLLNSVPRTEKMVSKTPSNHEKFQPFII
mgnify:CR=1 FL=1